MTPERMRVRIAEYLGWVWYRTPKRSSERRRYRCLFLPALHEYQGQSAEWLERADGSEAACNLEYIWQNGMVPDYPNDLNACHEMEKALSGDQQDDYAEHLADNFSEEFCDLAGTAQHIFACAHFTSHQRSVAFCRTVGIWEEEPTTQPAS